MSTNIRTVAASAVQAANRISSLIRETPLDYSPFFSGETGAEVYLKLENFQRTGSFKIRGASNKMMTLTADQRANGCIAASSGNHGAAVAYAMQKLDTRGVIFVPEQTSSTKVDAIRSYGGEVRFCGTDALDTERYAREYAVRNGMVYLSPYNDVEVIAGQGTCGVEIAKQLPDVDAVFVAVGGGGLISGIGCVLKARNKDVRITGCQPAASAVMAKSVEAGYILDIPSDTTLSDGTAGGVEAGSITFDLCREVVDEFILVSESQIAAAMRQYVEAEHQLIEGAAGVAIAALLGETGILRGTKVVVVICGANISRAALKSII